ncbi:hypothetical protein [Streptomyces sp. NPDC057287]
MGVGWWAGVVAGKTGRRCAGPFPRPVAELRTGYQNDDQAAAAA